MKLKELIEKINKLKLNEYDEDQLAEWVTELENYMILNIFNRAEGMDYEQVRYRYEEDGETELMVPDPFSEVYLHYLASKIDYWQQEIESYNNSVLLYNTAYQAFADYMRRKHKPKSRPNRKICLH